MLPHSLSYSFCLYAIFWHTLPLNVLFCFIGVIYIVVSISVFLPSILILFHPFIFSNQMFLPYKHCLLLCRVLPEFQYAFYKTKKKRLLVTWLHSVFIFWKLSIVSTAAIYSKFNGHYYAIDISPNLRTWAKTPFFLSEVSWSF